MEDWGPIIFIVVLVVGCYSLSFIADEANPPPPPKIGKRGGRYEIRYSRFTGKPYRHYF